MHQILAFTRSEAVEKVTTFVLVNILWMIFSALLVTLPLATAGLFAVTMRLARGETVDAIRTFFDGMKRYALKSVAIFAVNLLIGAVVVLNFQAFSQMEMNSLPAIFSLNITVLVAALAILINLYLWPLMVTVDLPLKRLVSLAVKMVSLHLLWSVLVAMVALLPLLASLVLPGLFLLIGIYAASALIISRGAWQVLEKYNLETL
ncbi:MAG: DUF624 domain-containing protein [Anaerolineae bacterium]|nr:DUF624 domain-containing protein [Anaerolineae bacterium]